MSTILRNILGLMLRTGLLLMGLVVLLSLLAAGLVLLLLWGLRALWARLTGRPVQPLVFTVLRRAQWQRFYRAGGAAPASGADVIDVEARPVDAGPAERLGR